MYGYICPECGAHLDPGEICDCTAEREELQKEVHDRMVVIEELLEIEEDGQLRMAV